MAEILEEAVQTEIDADESMPLQLAEFYLDSGIKRYAMAPSSIVFPTGEETYYPIYFESGNRKISKDGQLITMDFKFDNRNGTLYTYNTIEPFLGKQFILKKVFEGAFGAAANYRKRIDGFMQEPQFDKEWMYLKVIEGKALGFRNLNQFFYKPCNNVFGGPRCNKDGNADLTSLTASGTADSGTASTLTDNALTQADDYWNYGRIEITKAGITYHRKVIDFIAATDTVYLDVPLPFAVANGDTYTIYKGCPLTLNACRANSAFGPSADNSANFIGFIHLMSKGG